MAVDFPMPGVIDIRMPIVGDSYGWAGIEPTAAKKSIVIHGTASEAANEDGFTMAEYHVNNNGWDGIGVHFVITKDSYPGRPGVTPPGAQIQYVGDLGTWRAGCLNQNPGRVHIEISGLFTGHTPSDSQLRLARALCAFMLAPNNILPSLNFPSQITYHNAVPGQNTACPGWQYHAFGEWFNYVQGGAEPSWFQVVAPAPVATPAPTPVLEPAPVSVPVTVPVPTPTIPEPAGSVLDNEPEYRSSYTAHTESVATLMDGNAIDMTGAGSPLFVPKGTIVNIVGKFTENGNTYLRSEKSVKIDAERGTYYGLLEDYAGVIGTGQASGDVIVRVAQSETNSLLISLSKAAGAVIGAILKVFGRKKNV